MSSSSKASLRLERERGQTLDAELREPSELEHASPLAGARFDLRGVTVDALLADVEDNGIIFLPLLASRHRFSLAGPSPVHNVEGAGDEQHAAAAAKGNLLASADGL
ncbi:hypothetical protein [Bradyrhizobium pachyrhizi]|uniref:hypothetical protein n=1 Tax=Bradyrhizobium pachyrhizi TaxID=280333 RepID=UPI0012E3425A|nr:hypothetical protein [Bradyrhizobium pachyrhizi]